MKEYFDYSQEMTDGYPATCWVFTGCRIDMTNLCAYLDYDGFKDFKSKELGKDCKGKKTVKVEGIHLFSIYAAMHDTIIAATLADKQFEGGKLIQIEDK